MQQQQMLFLSCFVLLLPSPCHPPGATPQVPPPSPQAAGPWAGAVLPLALDHSLALTGVFKITLKCFAAHRLLHCKTELCLRVLTHILTTVLADRGLQAGVLLNTDALHHCSGPKPVPELIQIPENLGKVWGRRKDYCSD